MRKTVDKAADELYALAPADFTSSRNEREKALRKEGDREAAAAVKALRKPTVPAWALNQVARHRAKEVKRLVAAGAKLRDAQDKLLGGGKRDPLDKATRALRELTSELTRAAVELAADAGQATGAAFQESVKSTLHAAALDEEVAAELQAGRLVKEREVVSLPGLGAGGELAPARKPPQRGKPAKRGAGRAGRRRPSPPRRPSRARRRSAGGHGRSRRLVTPRPGPGGPPRRRCGRSRRSASASSGPALAWRRRSATPSRLPPGWTRLGPRSGV